MNNINLKNLTKEQLEDLQGQINEALKEPEFGYPLCMRYILTGNVVLFEKPNTGTFLKIATDAKTTHKVGDVSKTLVPHTHTDVWEEIPYDKERGFYHGQLVWCWNTNDTHIRVLRFYSATCKTTFSFNAKGYVSYTNYAPFVGEPPEGMDKEMTKIGL